MIMMCITITLCVFAICASRMVVLECEGGNSSWSAGTSHCEVS